MWLDLTVFYGKIPELLTLLAFLHLHSMRAGVMLST
jgi:hypothetical protein